MSCTRIAADRLASILRWSALCGDDDAPPEPLRRGGHVSPVPLPGCWSCSSRSSVSERGSKLVEGTPRFAEFMYFSGTHGQWYFLPIGEGTDEHTLSFVSWLLVRIELLALLMQTVVA